MKAVEQNPYRILGLLVGATAKEQNRQITRLKRFLEAEQEPEDDFSFPVLGEFHRTLNDVEEVAAKLNLDNDKMQAALFWFWNGNPITDEVAFEALKAGDGDAAKNIWEKLITTANVTQQNASAYHNLSIYFLGTEKTIADAIKYQIQFLESDVVKDFKELITDATYKATQKDLQLLFLNQILLEIEHSRMMTISEFVNLLNGLAFTAKEIFLNNLAQKQIEKVERHVDAAQAKKKADKTNAVNAGEQLYAATTEELILLKDILGTDNIKYSSIADKVATEMLQCGIEYYNEKQENIKNEDIGRVIALINQARSVAIGKIVQSKIDENLTIITDIKRYALCYYCGREIADSDSTFKAKIYRETARYSNFNSRKVEFQEAEISIPRCKKCKGVHTTSGWEYFTFPIIGVLLLWLTDWHWFACLAVGGTAGLIIAAIVVFLQSSIKATKANIKTEDYVYDFELARKLLNEGWTFSKPQA